MPGRIPVTIWPSACCSAAASWRPRQSGRQWSTKTSTGSRMPSPSRGSPSTGCATTPEPAAWPCCCSRPRDRASPPWPGPSSTHSPANLRRRWVSWAALCRARRRLVTRPHCPSRTGACSRGSAPGRSWRFHSGSMVVWAASLPHSVATPAATGPGATYDCSGSVLWPCRRPSRAARLGTHSTRPRSCSDRPWAPSPMQSTWWMPVSASLMSARVPGSGPGPWGSRSRICPAVILPRCSPSSLGGCSMSTARCSLRARLCSPKT